MKIELKRSQEPARIRFMNACERYTDPKGIKNNLPFDKVKLAFNAAYLLPLPTDQELKKLFTALEAWYNEENMIVNWSKILDAIAHRQSTSVRGIFPRILSKSNP